VCGKQIDAKSQINLQRLTNRPGQNPVEAQTQTQAEPPGQVLPKCWPSVGFLAQSAGLTNGAAYIRVAMARNGSLCACVSVCVCVCVCERVLVLTNS